MSCRLNDIDAVVTINTGEFTVAAGDAGPAYVADCNLQVMDIRLNVKAALESIGAIPTGLDDADLAPLIDRVGTHTDEVLRDLLTVTQHC